MASLRDVKTKIGAVKKTKQITKAMNMVASAKLRNAQSRIERFKPYAQKFFEMLGDLAAGADESVHPLLAKREEKKTVGIVIVTSDRGLCGSFNANIIKAALKLAKEKKAEGLGVKFYCVGKKGRDAVRKAEHEIVVQYRDVMNSFDFTLASKLGGELINSFLDGTLDEVVLCYGEFISMGRQVPVAQTVLPISGTPGEATSSGKDYVYEPSVEGLLAELLPRFVKVQVYRGMLDTSASEHAARMTAMDNATRACDDMINSLTLLYNKTRQAAITRDLMDIVGATEALK
ncbi:MAG TPA: F0F1 ATP synthase subunit gamma [Humidesulfovibrio sp.]|jgi:F-type H+-transporting ATPase subunit gamma|uniref:F0F1 ATP synthase subunit gamma n=1 Tax=Humidesulfovibrio sp. TaxID=2910988 RepID=UPI002C3F4FB8|nr:F0F1 ATP synthase subunit gamma [Humidesulfovibrio sp.]HWR04440.1 F0F1 ATP synthase subunit gamma [Humidesulfovibrio sp.]